MTIEKFDQKTLELGRLVAKAFRDAAGFKKPVDALGILMKDGTILLAVTNDRTSATGPIQTQLAEHYGSAATFETMLDQRDVAISITGRLTAKGGDAKDRVVRVNGQPNAWAWTAFTS